MYHESIAIVVSEQEVHTRCLDGYRVAEIVYTDRVDFAEEKTVDDHNGYKGEYGRQEHSVTKPVVLREPRFVMLLSETEAISRVCGELEALKLSNVEAEASAAAADKAVEERDRRIKSLEITAEDTNAKLREERATRDELRTTNRKLESDIGKVREAVGSVRMKEILGT